MKEFKMQTGYSISDVFDALSEWVVFIEPEEQKILWTNQSFRKDFVQCQDVVGQKFPNVAQNKFLVFNGIDPLEKTIRTGQNSQAEFFLVDDQGVSRTLQVSTTSLKNNSDQIEKIVWLCRDISRTIKVDEKIRYMAFYDELTGLYNRNMFCDRLRQALVSAKREKQSVALIYLDLDQFKRVNDSQGHSFGDLLLNAVAGRIRSCIRENDTVARIGGDEFVILASCQKRYEIDVVVQKIMRCFSRSFVLEDRLVPMTGSIGVAVYPEDADSAKVLMSRADIAMYSAKKCGPHSCQYYSDDLATKVQARRGLIEGLQSCAGMIK